MANNNHHLKEIVEIVGVVSIVASVLLVAWEIRQSNRIAGSEISMRIAEEINEIHSDRATAPEFAKLFPKLAAPERHLVTATEHSQIQGLAWRYVNIFMSVQGAHDNGLVSRQVFERYSATLSLLIERYPGLHPHLVRISAELPQLRSMEIMRPIADLAEQPAKPDENQ